MMTIDSLLLQILLQIESTNNNGIHVVVTMAISDIDWFTVTLKMGQIS